MALPQTDKHMPWPTMAEVEAADRETLRVWFNDLPATTTTEQMHIIRRISDRMRDLSPHATPRLLPVPAHITAAKLEKAKRPALAVPKAAPEPEPMNHLDFFAGLKGK